MSLSPQEKERICRELAAKNKSQAPFVAPTYQVDRSLFESSGHGKDDHADLTDIAKELVSDMLNPQGTEQPIVEEDNSMLGVVAASLNEQILGETAQQEPAVQRILPRPAQRQQMSRDQVLAMIKGTSSAGMARPMANESRLIIPIEKKTSSIVESTQKDISGDIASAIRKLIV